MMKQFLSKTLVLLLAFLMVFSCLGTAVFAAETDAAEKDETEGTKLQEIQELLNANEYSEYRLLYGEAPNGEDDITIPGAEYNSEKSDAKVFVDKDFLGGDEQVIYIGENGDVTWDFQITKSGNYHIAITYAPVVEYDGDGDGKADFVSNSWQYL